MANDEWNSMGCGGTNDEWKCVEAIGQEAADAAWATHWDTWITKEDIDQIASYGLNTIRVPVGFWIKEDLVYDDEFYPRGGLEYLDRLVGWAREAGLYVIMDLYGGPGSQYPNQQFTGHVSSTTAVPPSLGNDTYKLGRASTIPASTQPTTLSAPPTSSSGWRSVSTRPRRTGTSACCRS